MGSWGGGDLKRFKESDITFALFLPRDSVNTPVCPVCPRRYGGDGASSAEASVAAAHANAAEAALLAGSGASQAVHAVQDETGGHKRSAEEEGEGEEAKRARGE